MSNNSKALKACNLLKFIEESLEVYLYRKHSKLFAFLVIFGVLFASAEIHSDHDANDLAQTQHCCVQCCPSHNLMHSSTSSTFLAPWYSPKFPIISSEDFVPETVPQSIFHPPRIVS